MTPGMVSSGMVSGGMMPQQQQPMQQQQVPPQQQQMLQQQPIKQEPGGALQMNGGGPAGPGQHPQQVMPGMQGMGGGPPGMMPQQMLPGMTMGHNGGLPNGMTRPGSGAGAHVMSNGVPVLRNSSRATPGPWTASAQPAMMHNVSMQEALCRLCQLLFSWQQISLNAAGRSGRSSQGSQVAFFHQVLQISFIDKQPRQCSICFLQGMGQQRGMMNGMAPSQMSSGTSSPVPGMGGPVKLEQQQQHPQQMLQHQHQRVGVDCSASLPDVR